MITTIDISENEETEVLVENTHGFSYAIRSCDLTVEINFEQAQSLYKSLKEFFDE